MTAHAVGASFRGSSDNWNFNASNPCLHFGGNYNQNGNHGLFYVNYNSVSNSSTNIGCRVLLGLATHLHNRQANTHAGARTPSAPLGADEPSGHGLVPSRNRRERGKGREAKRRNDPGT